MKKIGLNIAVIGGPGAGKSTWIKAFSKGKKAFIFDPNQEYEYNEAGERTGIVNYYRGPIEPKTFAKYINERSQQAVNIFEEATAFITHSNPTPDNLNILTRKRHRRVVNLYVFHQLNALPAWVFPYLDYIVLFNTKDRRDLIEKKYSLNPEILETFYQQSRNRQKFKPTIKKLS